MSRVDSTIMMSLMVVLACANDSSTAKHEVPSVASSKAHSTGGLKCCFGHKDCSGSCDGPKDWCASSASHCGECGGSFCNGTVVIASQAHKKGSKSHKNGLKCCYDGCGDSCDSSDDWCSASASHCEKCGGGLCKGMVPVTTPAPTTAAPATTTSSKTNGSKTIQADATMLMAYIASRAHKKGSKSHKNGLKCCYNGCGDSCDSSDDWCSASASHCEKCGGGLCKGMVPVTTPAPATTAPATTTSSKTNGTKAIQADATMLMANGNGSQPLTMSVAIFVFCIVAGFVSGMMISFGICMKSRRTSVQEPLLSA